MYELNKINIICRFGSCIVHSCHRDAVSTVELLDHHSFGRGLCRHRRHADSGVAHKGSFTIVNIIYREYQFRGREGGLRRARVLFLKC